MATALRYGAPVGVDDIDTTMAWPGFRQAAARMGLHASLSVPPFAGSGATIAVLNLYGHDPVTLVGFRAQSRWSTSACSDAADPPSEEYGRSDDMRRVRSYDRPHGWHTAGRQRTVPPWRDRPFGT
jgi:hypothetical protein